ncbi:uncharacterized protein LOC120339098 [Styela clava]|uniref:uncharacterized protein LOC120339098 n=1 Tax=Styela clava TaxID=7725 RepID=UPI00193AA9B4|nr:uncharacterized protein LOC120339098 [Styela clava]
MNSTVPTNATFSINTTITGFGNKGLTEWETYQIFAAALAAISLYIAVAQVMYCFIIVRQRRKRKIESKRGHGSTSEPRDLFVNTLNTLVVIAAVFAFMRCGFDFCWVMERFTDLTCEFSIKFKKTCYAISMLCVYLVLWLRQRIFYRNPHLEHLSTRTVRFISWSLSVLLVTGILFLGIFYLTTAIYVGTPNGCAVVKNPITVVRWYLLMFLMVPFQVCLLALYSYPLIKHMLVCDAIAGNADHVIPLIRRAAVAAGFCALTDISFAVIFLVYEQEEITLTTFLYDVNVVINVLGLILSFQNWQVRLVPWRMGFGSKRRVTEVHVNPAPSETI